MNKNIKILGVTENGYYAFLDCGLFDVYVEYNTETKEVEEVDYDTAYSKYDEYMSSTHSGILFKEHEDVLIDFMDKLILGA